MTDKPHRRSQDAVARTIGLIIVVLLSAIAIGLLMLAAMFVWDAVFTHQAHAIIQERISNATKLR